jgi:hypothetical protein
MLTVLSPRPLRRGRRRHRRNQAGFELHPYSYSAYVQISFFPSTCPRTPACTTPRLRDVRPHVRHVALSLATAARFQLCFHRPYSGSSCVSGKRDELSNHDGGGQEGCAKGLLPQTSRSPLPPDWRETRHSNLVDLKNFVADDSLQSAMAVRP